MRSLVLGGIHGTGILFWRELSLCSVFLAGRYLVRSLIDHVGRIGAEIWINAIIDNIAELACTDATLGINRPS